MQCTRSIACATVLDLALYNAAIFAANLVVYVEFPPPPLSARHRGVLISVVRCSAATGTVDTNAQLTLHYMHIYISHVHRTVMR
jgi:hypothetical protein